MRIQCRFSGVSFYCQGYNQLKVMGEHPLMQVPVRTLLSRAADWSRDTLDDTERRILFVALLKASELVEFRVPAVPTKQTIETNMELLLKTVSWKEGIGDSLRLPKYRVTENNYRIKNIGTFLRNWDDEKREWDGKTAEWRLREKLQRREDALNRIIRNAQKAGDYLKKLARWTMDASAAPQYIKDTWVEMFSTEDDVEIWNMPTVDIEELLEHLQGHLTYGSTAANAAFRRVYDLLDKNKKGINFSLMDEDDEEKKRNYQSYADNPFLIWEEPEFLEGSREGEEREDVGRDLLDQAERERNRRLFGDEFKGKSSAQVDAEFARSNERRIISLAPIAEPKRENYPGQVPYIKALASYRIAVRELKKQQEEDSKKREEALKRQKEEGSTEKLDIPFSDIDTETSNIVNILRERARSAKDE